MYTWDRTTVCPVLTEMNVLLSIFSSFLYLLFFVLTVSVSVFLTELWWTLYNNLTVVGIYKYCKMQQGASYKLKGGEKKIKIKNTITKDTYKKTTPLTLLNVSVDHPLPSASIEHFFWLGSCSTVTLYVLQTNLSISHPVNYIQLLSHCSLLLLAVWGKDQLVFREGCCLVTV